MAKSFPNKGKQKNGDSFNFYEDDSVIVATVADGVGGNVCDWKCSAQACEDLLYYFLHEYRHLGVKEGIAHSLRKTYAKIYFTKGECEGMLTTLISIIIDKETNNYFYFGVGDSLILKFEDDRIEELTPECEFRIQPDLLLSMVREGGQLQKDTSFALMSDGIYANRKSYKRELELVIQSAEWETKFDELMYLNQLTQSDDMTLMLLKNEQQV